MARKKDTLPELSKSEFDILRILWKRGKRSVREVHDELHPLSGWAYTTTKTMMDRMAKKGLLLRKDFHGIFLYEPRISRPAGLARFVQFFADRVLETDTQSVVAMFARSDAITSEEIEELEKLLAENG
jgi:BlaI family penicillinase repressor